MVSSISSSGEESHATKRTASPNEIDFGAGRWNTRIEGNQFKSDMAPKGGAMRVQVLVSGASTSDQTLVLQQYSMRMHQENH